ncbi:nSTAND1 domain-containing NTPase [Paraburkholderia sp. HD33-4]|uniref:nSTAND1 domain-containing NTPase n=1 Tax=Paraburkholderia sp. HD33-4 TaxID=2883242 RepID=UPI001F3191A7|nr:hypothetical protein [Paraburkholderia sp. HD33-4]
MATVIEFSSSPYPGLRPFRYDESDVFFGREKQIDLLITRLAVNRFLAVIGSSGCGKSSLVRAGLLPALNAGFMAQVGSRWRIIALRPGERPLRQLTRAVSDANLFGSARPAEESAAFVEASLRRGPLGLVEVVQSADALRDQALLVLVDQFEETFRYSESRPSDEAEAFVALLLASATQRECPIYVVVTMRSDYLGECAAFRGLAEAVSDSQYLTPRLTRDELELAIDGPARVFGGQIDPKLLNRLLNDFGTDADQLPLLQHALACMWDRKARSGIEAPRLTVDDCDAIGGVRMALSNHADEIVAELTPEQQRIMQVMFRRLSGSASGPRDVRAPARVHEIAQIANTSTDEVIAVAQAFARTDRCLLIAPEGAITADSMLDICHESLIRQWVSLRDWSEKEAQSAERYRLLEQTARRWRKGEAALWSTPDLEVALAWEARERPTATWARRYGGDFDEAMAFLRASEAKQRADVAAKESAQRAQMRRYRRYRWMVYGLVTLFVAASGGMAVYLHHLYDTAWEYTAYYNTIVSHWGIPVGYGRLTDAQVRQRPWSLKVVTRGRSGRVLRIEAVNSFGDCEPDNGIVQPLDQESQGNFLTSQKSLQECEWVYVVDADGKNLIYEKALNRDGKLVWGMAIPPQIDRTRQQAYYVGPDGSLKVQKNTRLHSVEFDYIADKSNKERDGIERSERYFTYAGGLRRPEPGPDNVYGVVKEYDANGLKLRMTMLGNGAAIVNDANGVAVKMYKHDALGNPVQIAFFDQSGRPVLSKDGYHLIRMAYDANGNEISRRYFGIDGRPVRCKGENYHEERKRYAQGEPVEFSYFDVDGSPAYNAAFLVHAMTMSFDRNRPMEMRFFDVHGKPVSGTGGQQGARISYDKNGNVASLWYINADGSAAYDMVGVHRRTWQYNESGKPVREMTFDNQDKPARTKGSTFGEIPLNSAAYGLAYDYDNRGEITSVVFLDRKGAPLVGEHRYAKIRETYDDRDNLTEVAYFDTLDRPVLLNQTGYAKIVTTYDDRRNPIKKELFDEHGERTIGNGGYATVEQTYDDRNRITELRFFGPDSKPILIEGRYAIQQRHYDARDNLVEQDLFGPNHQPVASGQASFRRKYDDRDRIIEEAYFDANGKPFADNGIVLARASFDASGFNVTRDYLDANGQRTADGNGCWGHRQTLDAHRNILEEICLGQDMKPTLSALGFGIKTRKYDAHGNVVEDAARDPQGHLVVMPNAYAVARQTFDPFDNLTGQDFFDTNGKLIQQPFGYAMMRKKYDGANLTEEAYYGADGKLTLQSDGYAMIRYAYDERDNEVERAYFGIDAKPLLQPTGFASQHSKYDRSNNLIEVAFYDANGNLLVQSDGFAIVRNKFDSRNNKIESVYDGPDGKPALTTRGYAAKRMQYDKHDQLTAVTFFDPAGKPVCLDATYARYCEMVFAYDKMGRMDSTQYMDLDGHAQITGVFSFDDKGNTTGVHYIGRNGEVVEYRETVMKVRPGTESEKLLRQGDVVMIYAGIRIDTPDTLSRLTREALGDSRDLQVLRDGRMISLKVKPGEIGFTDGTTFVAAH